MVENTYTHSCTNCTHPMTFYRSKVELGKIYKVPCPKCKHNNKVCFPEDEYYQSSDILNPKVIDFQYFARLVVPETINNRKQSFFLGEGQYTIGRKSTNCNQNFAIESKDRYMSKRHCRISFVALNNKSQYAIRALESPTPVILNNMILHVDEALILMSNDKIILGTTIIIFESYNDV